MVNLITYTKKIYEDGRSEKKYIKNIKKNIFHQVYRSNFEVGTPVQ